MSAHHAQDKFKSARLGLGLFCSLPCPSVRAGLPTRHPSFNILHLTDVLGLSLQRPCIYMDANATCLLSYLLLGCFFRFFLDLDLAGQLPVVADL